MERLSNVCTLAGTSVDLNVSGPTQVVPQPDGSLLITVLGSSLFLFSPGAAPQFPLLSFFHGRIQFVAETNGTFTLLSAHGHAEDICALVA